MIDDRHRGSMINTFVNLSIVDLGGCKAINPDPPQVDNQQFCQSTPDLHFVDRGGGVRGKNLFSILVDLCIKAWCHETMVTAPEIARGVPLQVYASVYASVRCHDILVTAPEMQEGKFYYQYESVLQSSIELAHAGYIYIVFCVLLIVLCFIMFLLSWDRSLGRCF